MNRKDCIHYDVCEDIDDGIALCCSSDCKHFATCVPATTALLDLKREIHNKAVHTHSKDVYSFVNLRVFDAVINNYIRKYSEAKNDDRAKNS